MNKVNIVINKNYIVGEIDRRLFGSFIEHLGRAVYTGIYEPNHPLADNDGFRTDVINAVKELNVSLIRYPGGNFVSGFDWRDSIGSNRPTRLSLAWRSLETNEFGLHEFSSWCKKVNVIPMMAVNMGTGTIRDAAEEVEYCNFPKGTYLSDLRIKNGSIEPFNINLWCIGNEMDGDWQIGHISAEDYGKKARECAKIMRLVNGEQWDTPKEKCLQLIVTGSSIKELPTFPDWDRKVLEYTYDVVDYLSMHRYYSYRDNTPNPIQDFLGAPTDLSDFINTIRGTIEFVKAKKRINKNVYISFDEWNVWDSTVPSENIPWKVHPHQLEQKYSFLDSLVVGGMMNVLLNNCDVVKIACLAQLVNVIAPILTEENGGLIKQTIFYPFSFASNNAKGVTLKSSNDSSSFKSLFGDAKEVNQAVTFDKEKNEISIFLCNYSTEDKEINFDFSSFGPISVINAELMHEENLFEINDFRKEYFVMPHALSTSVNNEKLSFVANKYSYNFIKIKLEK